jgi:hypothetical protein
MREVVVRLKRSVFNFQGPTSVVCVFNLRQPSDQITSVGTSKNSKKLLERMLTLSFKPSLSKCRFEDMFNLVSKRLQSVCHNAVTNRGSLSRTITRGRLCKRYAPYDKTL